MKYLGLLFGIMITLISMPIVFIGSLIFVKSMEGLVEYPKGYEKKPKWY